MYKKDGEDAKSQKSVSEILQSSPLVTDRRQTDRQTDRQTMKKKTTVPVEVVE
jgi:hypothetical protein